MVVLKVILNGIQEVVGSIPSSSTNDYKGLEGFPSKPFFVEYTKEYTNEIGWLEIKVRCPTPFCVTFCWIIAWITFTVSQFVAIYSGGVKCPYNRSIAK